MGYKIIIGGDLVPTESNKNQFINGDIKTLLGEKLLGLLQDADYRIFNLEAPLTNSNNKISKEGPAIKAEQETINGIKKMDVNLLTLANNHILDYRENGLKDTMELLRQNRINFVGAGNNLNEASKAFIIKEKGKKIGIYACVEHEYTLAGKDKGGANPFDPLNSLDDIEEISEQVDYLIVLYHGGKEFYRYPTPYLQKVCRKMVEKGANLVTCQHSHCIGTYEDYKNGKIIYGQGNFLFDRDDSINYELKQTGLLIELEFKDLNLFNPDIRFYPIRKQKEKIKLAEEEDSKEILEKFEERAKQIKEKDFIQKNFDEIALKQGGRYLLRLSKIGAILSAIDMRYLKGKMFTRKLKSYFNLRQRHTLENMLQCEVHNEIVLRYLQIRNNNKL